MCLFQMAQLFTCCYLAELNNKERKKKKTRSNHAAKNPSNNRESGGRQLKELLFLTFFRPQMKYTPRVDALEH